MDKKVLVIVDFQRDFCDKSGSLYVAGAETALENILKYIEDNKDSIEKVIFTADWHLPSDKSFKENGGEWAAHCVQYSEGAGINQELMNKVIASNIPYSVFKKGDSPNYEEYGAFDICVGNDPNIALVWNHKMSDTEYLKKDTKHVICGLAGDYCVWNTFKKMKKYGIDTDVLYDGIAFIEDKFDYVKRYQNEM